VLTTVVSEFALLQAIMESYTPPQARGQWPTSNTATQQRPSIWNKPNDSMNLSPSHAPRYAPTPAMPQTPSKAQSWRVVGSPTPSVNALPSPRVSPEAAPSVKHLTCYFWKAHGKCQHSDEDCLYAHYFTGQIADPPVQVEPGRQSIPYSVSDIDTDWQCPGPAVAGRNAMTARPVYENWRDQHGNLGVGPNMPSIMQTRMLNPVGSFHDMAAVQAAQYNGQHSKEHYLPPNDIQHEQVPMSPNFVHKPSTHHQRSHSDASDVSYERITGSLCALAGDLYSVVDKSHDTYAQAVVTLHAQCESLLKQAQNLYREIDPKPKACIETLVSAVSAIMPLIDQQKVMAAETEDAKQGIIENMKGAGLGYMARSWQTAPSDSSGTN